MRMCRRLASGVPRRGAVRTDGRRSYRLSTMSPLFPVTCQVSVGSL
jgi:hypothetical protein